MPAVFLKDSALLSVGGADAQSFLQNLITTDITSLAPDEARPGALLTPQGKILFDFMVWQDDGHGYVIETDAGQRDALLKRLTMYRLRAAVTLAPVAEAGVSVCWGEDADASAKASGTAGASGTAASPRPALR